MARKWKNIAFTRRKGISIPRSKGGGENESSYVTKGHFVVYSSDEKRFVIPLGHLNSEIFQVLLRLSEEEFGLTNEGPIRLTCDSLLMEYVVSIVEKG